ncbi:MAG TPA: ribosome assembly RNA-binding protein YhbY [Thermoanaerobaculia bacterium]|jgi:RNA-binding protein
MVLTGKQRQFLKGLAHPLSPVVRVGRGGVTQSVVQETVKSLHVHELIKVRIEVDDSSERRRLAEELATQSDAHIAGTVGKIAILYRERDEEPEIKLPR